MIDISVHELNKYYGSNHVIKGITFEIYSGEKVGLLGRNGSGKTTLFKIISKDEPYESGKLVTASGKSVEVLSQIPVFADGDTVEDILRSPFTQVMEVYEAMKTLEDSWSHGTGSANDTDIARYGKLMQQYELQGGYEIDVKIEKICNGMNITSKLRKGLFKVLSGGERTRVNLARILLRDCDILLLDEPTNHLDLASLSWLEHFLQEFSGTAVIISHDRVFLDNVVSRIIEIQDGKLNFYTGNYTFYVQERLQRYLTQAEQYKQQQRKINQLEVAIKRQRVWAQINPSNTGLAKRAIAMEKRIEQMDKVEKPTQSKKLAEDFNTGGYLAKEVVSFENVCKSYGAKHLLNNINLSVTRNDRIALIGENGCGKTTLVKLITGAVASDSGCVKISSNAKIAYLPQIVMFDNEAHTVLETMRYAFDIPEEKARSILANFRFNAPDVIKKVCNLSGGEKSRLKLCMLMQDKVNFLILDEPTNHLDIESREWIEDAVADWDGTILFISHDRYFLNKFASRIWEMKDGNITDYHGNFDDFLQATANKNPPKTTTPPTDSKKKKPANKSKEPPAPHMPVETQIYETEIKLEKVNVAIESETQTDYVKLDMLYQEKHLLEEQLNALYSQWANES
ncbi:MAG: ATP-binding cassette domain-containing protein [Defluviitaleaceae bacterium]|nr:ATP-binding cassette domain-containing protein [Defluviitaleaceae bacterium]